MNAIPRPRIWAIAHKELGELVTTIAPNYAHVAEIRLVDQVLDDAFPAAQQLVRNEEVDVFLCTGAIASRIGGEIDVPISLIKVTAFDMLKAIHAATSHSNRIALVTYGATNTELDEVKVLINADLTQCSYTDYKDARKQVNLLVNEGHTVIVGPSIIVDLAEKAGVKGVLLHSQGSVRDAIENAIDTARFRLNEETRLKRISAILERLDEGVLTTDVDGAIRLINPAMERLLGTSKEWAQGKHISQVIDDSELGSVVKSGEPILGKVQKIGKKTVVVNYIPLKPQGLMDGIVVTCQDGTDIEQADRKIKSHNRKRQFAAKYHLTDIIGNSLKINEAKQLAAQFSKVDSTVLINGESGTGKELFAQGIHQASIRRNHPFVAINCAAFPESLLESELFGYEEGAFTGSRRGGKPGLIELAHKGTLFLDEIGDMPLSLQAKLLRVLQEREVVRLGGSDAIMLDVRIITATNRDLRLLVANGRFREDFYFRINILNLHIPPLRMRMDDIAVLASAYIKTAMLEDRHTPKISEAEWREILTTFRNYAWPGNVRELENALERLMVAVKVGQSPMESCEIIFGSLMGVDVKTSPTEDQQEVSTDLRTAVRDQELETILKVLEKNKGNKATTSKQLGLSRTTLWRKLQRQ